MKYNVDKTKSTREDSVAEQVHFVRNRERCSSQAKNEKGKIDEKKERKTREARRKCGSQYTFAHPPFATHFECIYMYLLIV